MSHSSISDKALWIYRVYSSTVANSLNALTFVCACLIARANFSASVKTQTASKANISPLLTKAAANSRSSSALTTGLLFNEFVNS
jgi:hypothetical protein